MVWLYFHSGLKCCFCCVFSSVNTLRHSYDLWLFSCMGWLIMSILWPYAGSMLGKWIQAMVVGLESSICTTLISKPDSSSSCISEMTFIFTLCPLSSRTKDLTPVVYQIKRQWDLIIGISNHGQESLNSFLCPHSLIMSLGTTQLFSCSCLHSIQQSSSNIEIISSKSLVLVHIVGLVGLILRRDSEKEISNSQNWVQRAPEGGHKQHD